MNTKLSLLSLLLITVFLFGSCSTQSEWELVWSDEFEEDGQPDPAKWGYEEGYVRNKEVQFYTPENAVVKDGMLVIETLKTDNPERPVTSSSLTTEGKAEWTYGRIEVRAKLPTGKGMWPAIWMLGVNRREVGWPDCGEIDIMENVGFEPDVIHANIHTKAYNHVKKTNKGGKLTVTPPYENFHRYIVEWTPEKMDFYVCENKYFTYKNEGTGDDVWPFDNPHYLILNAAYGGSWGGREGIENSILPQQFLIDYVRVYQKK